MKQNDTEITNEIDINSSKSKQPSQIQRDINDVNKENIPYKFNKSATSTTTAPINSLNINLSPTLQQKFLMN